MGIPINLLFNTIKDAKGVSTVLKNSKNAEHAASNTWHTLSNGSNSWKNMTQTAHNARNAAQTAEHAAQSTAQATKRGMATAEEMKNMSRAQQAEYFARRKKELAEMGHGKNTIKQILNGEKHGVRSAEGGFWNTMLNGVTNHKYLAGFGLAGGLAATPFVGRDDEASQEDSDIEGDVYDPNMMYDPNMYGGYNYGGYNPQQYMTYDPYTMAQWNQQAQAYDQEPNYYTQDLEAMNYQNPYQSYDNVAYMMTPYGPMPINKKESGPFVSMKNGGKLVNEFRQRFNFTK